VPYGGNPAPTLHECNFRLATLHDGGALSGASQLHPSAVIAHRVVHHVVPAGLARRRRHVVVPVHRGGECVTMHLELVLGRVGVRDRRNATGEPSRVTDGERVALGDSDARVDVDAGTEGSEARVGTDRGACGDAVGFGFVRAQVEVDVADVAQLVRGELLEDEILFGDRLASRLPPSLQRRPTDKQRLGHVGQCG
jgi:hypothetical protein